MKTVLSLFAVACAVTLGVLALAYGGGGPGAGTAGAQAEGAVSPDPPPGRVRAFVTFASDAGPGEQDRLLGDHGAAVRFRYGLVDGVAIELPEQALAGLAANPRVARVEPDLTAYAIIHPTAAGDAELHNSWGVEHVGSGANHSAGYRGAGTKIGILDTGLNTTHVDLDGNYNAACSYDYVNIDSDPMDDHGHGSHVGGIAAGEDNGTGVVGMAPDADICAYKVLASNGGGSWSNIVAGLNQAVTDGVDVVNFSLGSSVYPGDWVQTAFTSAYAAGVVIIASAGNSGTCAGDTDTVVWPARFAESIAVAASDGNDISPCFSSTGDKVELTGPGVSVCSAWRGTTPGCVSPCSSTAAYCYASGTSMSGPHVAGLAAVMLGCNSALTNLQVRDKLDQTAKDLDSPLAPNIPPGLDGRDTWYGYGLIQAQAAATAAGCGSAPPAPTATYTPAPPTATATHTAVPPAATATYTSVPPTPTYTPPPASVACAQPVITGDSDSLPFGGGIVAFTWSTTAASGATQYTVQRQQSGGSWSTRQVSGSTSYLGNDSGNDPLWRVYVSAGGCSPLPGLPTQFDPGPGYPP